ncbi:DUF3788 domain-containing protein [Flavobacterium sp. SUN046]|jgi:hypothetical protein|uniref:DUF3788 domain-containing protein n=1 Tax=Flavobacterium sp. SUN046 TaxID=3002440 RepID=UPI002DBDEE36|nr:DUF3788 domain-containing protein [Flavobacterium sp. SUN046]MEC4048263.1 DUF3788 domain-containing protein [Flavobacterium sp. SUN046]
MPISIFTDKAQMPKEEDLIQALGTTYPLWKAIEAEVIQKYTEAKVEWNYSGAKFGWSYRIKDKKRVLVYLLPRDHYFKVALVFGQKATDTILQTTINQRIKTALQEAKVYAEGRGIRIDIKDDSLIMDIKELISIKLAH